MVSAEYTRLETDLNKGAAGHFVYLCYKKGRDEPPISDLCAPPLPIICPRNSTLRLCSTHHMCVGFHIESALNLILALTTLALTTHGRWLQVCHGRPQLREPLAATWI